MFVIVRARNDERCRFELLAAAMVSESLTGSAAIVNSTSMPPA